MNVIEHKAILGKNISALTKKSFVIPESLLSEFGESGLNELIRTKDGNYTCRVTVGNASKYVNSAYKPWEEAKKQLLPYSPKKEISTVYYLRVGLGYHLRLLLDMSPPGAVVHLFESDLNWLLKAFSLHDFSNDVEQGRLLMAAGQAFGYEDFVLSDQSYVWRHPVLGHPASSWGSTVSEPVLNPKKKRVLVVSLFDYGAYRNLSDSCAAVFEDKGLEVFHCGHTQEDIDRMLKEAGANILFSLSFSLRLSYASKKLDIPYLCWELDKNVNPDILNPSYISSKTHIFTTYFDDVTKYQKAGASSYFLPAAPNILLPGDYTLTDAEQTRYGCDISFVGSPLISINNEYSRLKGELIDIFRGSDLDTQKQIIEFNRKVDRILEKQNKYSMNNVFLLPEIFERELDVLPNGISLDREHLKSILAKECCRHQRFHFLRELAPLSVDIYGNSDWRSINERNFCYRGEAGFDYECGKIYRASKINLDITRIYTLDGFSDRVFNVLLSGGFLLMNRTHNIDRFFEDGREVVLFDNPRDLKEKCLYYLNSEKERKEIAERGQNRVKGFHTVENRVTFMLAEVEIGRGFVFSLPGNAGR